jgi:serum/glucocorticoid-regulated kinase 2
LVTDYAPGGELFFWLKRERVFSQSRVRLYAAELVLALEHLHSKDIVYRDLKPENILLDAEGHIKITDFGLSKGNVRGFGAEGGTNTFCGTPEYLAPEILDERRWHGKAVDWWSLGTLLYEMCAGLPPFYDENVEVMYEKIMTETLSFPRHFVPETRDLLARMLERDVTKRLGYNGAEEIKAHKFFAGLDWDAVLAKAVKPAFVPPASRGEADVGNFEEEFTTQAPVDSMPDPKGDLSATAVEKTHFENFTYVGTSDALVGHASPGFGLAGADSAGHADAAATGPISGAASRASKSRGPASREPSTLASPESTPTARD